MKATLLFLSFYCVSVEGRKVSSPTERRREGYFGPMYDLYTGGPLYFLLCSVPSDYGADPNTAEKPFGQQPMVHL